MRLGRYDRPNGLVRPHLVLALALIPAFSACSGARGSAANASPAPLQPCETRDVRVDRADLTVESNANATLASVVVENAPNASAGAAAVKDIERIFGMPSPDPRTVERPWKLGLTQLTDPCGRVIEPTASP